MRQELDADLQYVAYSLTGVVQRCHADANNAGWWTDIETGKAANRNVPEALMLIVTEIAEACEAHRKDLYDQHLPKRKGIEVELADAVIRICDLAGGLNLDIGSAVAEKLQYNRSRVDHMIENRKLSGGKKY